MTVKVLLALLLAFSLALGPAKAQRILRVGVIDQPDGSLLRGARLAADDINAGGGLVDGAGAAHELLIVDTRPDHMEVALANMRQARVIAVIGPVANDALARNLPGLQALDVPVLTPAISDTVLLPDASGRIFRSRAQDKVQTGAIADYLVNKLDIRDIATLQLDRASTGRLIAFANALAAFGVRPANHMAESTGAELDEVAAAVARSRPGAVALYGEPALAARAFNRLRGAGYGGEIVYREARSPGFIELVPAEALRGIVGADTWSLSRSDGASEAFTLAYARAFGALPDALSAAGYDAARLIESAFAGAGGLARSLARIDSHAGIQGELRPARLLPGETSGNVVVTRLNGYGSANAVARYDGGRLVSADQISPASPLATATPRPTVTPLPTATPSQLHLIIELAYQNVRSGPGLEYDVIGQLPQGAQARALGATADYSWLVVDFAGQWGWLAAYLVETVGGGDPLPIIQPPATPTPAPTATPLPPSEPDLVVVGAGPPRLIIGRPITVEVTVMNRGLSGAGAFAIATSLEPGGRYVGVNAPGLGAGQQITLQLPQTLDGAPGPQSVIIVVDLNQQVAEGAAGEANNQVFSYRYIADRPVIASNTWTVSAGAFDLEGAGGADFRWTGVDLEALGGARMFLLREFTSLDEAHYGAIDPARANLGAINASQLEGAIIGFITAEGRRGVLRASGVNLYGTMSLSYRVYG